MYREKEVRPLSGWLVTIVLFVALIGSGYAIYLAADADASLQTLGWGLTVALELFLFFGLFRVNPNEAKVLQLFGAYSGTVHEPGLQWMNPLLTKKAVSKRVRNFETAKLKVNDNHGNPIEIAAVVVWKVVDSAEAVFEVDNYDNFVHV